LAFAPVAIERLPNRLISSPYISPLSPLRSMAQSSLLSASDPQHL